MKTPANYHPQTAARQLTQGWLPAGLAAPRALDLSHWLSRAARGHTWNGHGATQRRRTH